MISVLELTEQARSLSAEEFVRRYGPVALLARPPDVEFERAKLKLVEAQTIASMANAPFLDDLLVMLRGFRTLEAFFFNPDEPSQTFALGRDARSFAVIDEPSVSKLHATLSFRDGVWHIHDEQSRNGTWVNADNVSECELSNGDMVGLGDTALIFIHTSTLHSQLLAIPTRER